MSELDSTQFQGVARVEEVEFPRKLRRVDLVPVDVDGASDGPKAGLGQKDAFCVSLQVTIAARPLTL